MAVPSDWRCSFPPLQLESSPLKNLSKPPESHLRGLRGEVKRKESISLGLSQDNDPTNYVSSKSTKSQLSGNDTLSFEVLVDRIGRVLAGQFAFT